VVEISELDSKGRLTMLTRRAALGGLAALGLPLPARADDFPTRAITIIVPYTPAGPVDTTAPLVAQEMSADLRQPVIVENRPGGSGIIGTNAVARANPDGYTLVFGTNQTHVTNQSLVKNCPYDAVRDFSPVGNIIVTPHVLVVRKDLAPTSVAELVAFAKSKPGHLTFGTIGPGSSAHLATELFKLKAGIDMLHVPFKGLAPLTTELLAGRIDLSIAPLPGLMQKQIEDDKLRALALASAKRTDFLPSIPTFAESGLPGVEADALGALFAPAKTLPAVIDRLYRAVMAAAGKENFKAAMLRQGIPIVLIPPAEMSTLLPREVAKWADVIKLAHIPME
jgi:tripartite-type tricarboxylate transporter receptor subunit TctC